VDTNEDRRGVQVFIVFLHSLIALVGPTPGFVVEFDAGAAGSSEEVREEGCQWIKHGIFQTGTQKPSKQKFGDGELVGRTFLGLWLFLHGALRRQLTEERFEEGFVLNGLRETRRAKHGQWRVNGRKARTGI